MCIFIDFEWNYIDLRLFLNILINFHRFSYNFIDFYRFSLISIDFDRFSYIFIDFYGFLTFWARMPGFLWRPVAPCGGLWHRSPSPLKTPLIMLLYSKNLSLEASI